MKRKEAYKWLSEQLGLPPEFTDGCITKVRDKKKPRNMEYMFPGFFYAEPRAIFGNAVLQR